MARQYGLGATQASTAATGGDLDGSAAAAYTFSNPQSKVMVSSHPSSGPALLYIVWNDAASPLVTATNWDAVIEPGQQIASPDGIHVTRVGLLGSSASTYQTGHAVRGFE